MKSVHDILGDISVDCWGNSYIEYDADKIIAALKAEGYIIVRNEEPSELGFSCQICGCEFKP